MENISYHLNHDKVIIRVRNRMCSNVDELLKSPLFADVLTQFLQHLQHRRPKFLGIFEGSTYSPADIDALKQALLLLTHLPAEDVQKLVPGSQSFFCDKFLFNEFVEQLYNYWRRLHRLVICDSVFDRLDRSPYRTFNDMVESLMHLVRSAYRDIQENITGNHPKIYRQIHAGAEVGAITRPHNMPYPPGAYDALQDIFLIRQALIYPPMIFKTPMNRRQGTFARCDQNPLEGLALDPQEWLCYPAKVGPLLIMVYFSLHFFELGFSLCNLFELADEEDLQRKPDAIYLYGAPPEHAKQVEGNETIFYEDTANDLLVASIPLKDEYAYFGYLKKMVLTLHNIKRMQAGSLPFHGAMLQLTVRGCSPFNVLIIGDTGAGKSETIEALRQIARGQIDDILIIADDMGSLELTPQGALLAYGTEMGAFVRLDDLQTGFALGQIDRTILMNFDQVNARVVLPVTRYEYVMQGTPLDCVLYANNYEVVDAAHPAIETFRDPQQALQVFRRGAVMSKGTTTSTGLVESYFANIFGPPQYRALHDQLAEQYFDAFFEQGVVVGQLRTMLGLPGYERSGPEQAARALLDLIRARNI